MVDELKYVWEASFKDVQISSLKKKNSGGRFGNLKESFTLPVAKRIIACGHSGLERTKVQFDKVILEIIIHTTHTNQTQSII